MTETVVPAAPAAPRSHVDTDGREFLAIVAGCMAMAALSIDLMLPAFDDMREAFGMAPDDTSVSWFITAFFLGLGVGQLVYGPLSDRFGRKPLLYAGLLLYVASGIAASFMPNLGSLAVCRVLWGLGAAAPRSLSVAMVRDVFEGDRMARTMSLVMATFVMVPVLAPAVGALFLLVLPWRAVFWVPLLIAVGLALWLRRLPETLPPARRRSVHPTALLEAFRVVVTTRVTMAYGIVITCLFGIMTSYLGSSEIIFDEVYDQADLFPVLFGVLALMLGAGSLLNARIVMRLGLHRLLHVAALYLLTTAGLGALLAAVTDGEPPIWLFCVAIGVMLPSVSILTANSNTAAMLPVGHVAGMAAAVLGTLATLIGALLGSAVDAAFDGTVRPFWWCAFGFASVSAASVFLLARPAHRAGLPEHGPVGRTPS